MKTRFVCLGMALIGLGSAPLFAENYVVLYPGSIPSTASKSIQRAGGTVRYSYPQIGVVIANSTSSTFASLLSQDKTVEGVSATSNFASQIKVETEVLTGAAQVATSVPWGTEPLSGLQWDMVQIQVPEAHAITGGSPSIIVGDLDSGVDYTHPDLAANIDFTNSVSCLGGVPNQDPTAWNDDNGHGTHTAGTIAAAANGIGIVGVAPGVKLAAVRVANADGYIFPEAAICGFMWAAAHSLDVINNSYFVDPWLFNCRNDASQRPIWKAVRRAVSFAISNGVVVVASMGNENMDLSKTNIDTLSPDFPPGSGVARVVTNACAVIPVEVPGVIGVSADGNLLQKSYYSSYGVGVTQLVAPGGDRRFQNTAPTHRGYVLSTFPGGRYALAQGTSMAAPHVTGVAALVLSQRYRPPGAVAGVLNSTADPIPCPPNPFSPGPPYDYEAICAGGDGYNGFYGHGQVNAYRAVTGSR